MNGIWLISYLALWLLLLSAGAVILILAHEVEKLNDRLGALERRESMFEKHDRMSTRLSNVTLHIPES
jgi:hypothetical protein